MKISIYDTGSLKVEIFRQPASDTKAFPWVSLIACKVTSKVGPGFPTLPSDSHAVKRRGWGLTFKASSQSSYPPRHPAFGMALVYNVATHIGIVVGESGR